MNIYLARIKTMRTKELTIDLVKKHLNLDPEYTADDMYLYQLILAVQNSILKKCNLPLRLGNTNQCIYYNKQLEKCNMNETCVCSEWASSKKFEPALIQAMLLLIGNLYANREPVTGLNANKIPYTFDYLLESYVNYGKFNHCEEYY